MKPENPFSKLRDTAPVEAPVQKIVPARKNKRATEKVYTLWIDRDLLRKLKFRAVELDSSIKDIATEAIRKYLANAS